MQKIFRVFVEIMFGLQIAAAPTLLGIILGFVIYVQWPTSLGAGLGICCAIFGLCGGLIWAYRISRTRGTANFVSRINATPELDAKDDAPQE
ncbi:MAG TPA: hypothetical protein PKL15_11705 [Saprospiraceae bacterium]|nr:hypothetical protein [Saprospiraceae bacterium]